MDVFKLSRNWFNYCFENPEKIKPIHTALYFFIIEHNNRLAWKEKFGLPTEMTKEAIGVKNYRTYTNALNDLAEWGFIIFIERCKNQYSSNIIAIAQNTKAHTKALDKAMYKHSQKHSQKQSKSIVSIDIPYNQEPINQNTFNFKNELIKLGATKENADAWLQVRKTKKATNSQKAFELFKKQVENSQIDINIVLEMCIEKDWKGFNSDWITQSKGKLPIGELGKNIK